VHGNYDSDSAAWHVHGSHGKRKLPSEEPHLSGLLDVILLGDSGDSTSLRASTREPQ